MKTYKTQTPDLTWSPKGDEDGAGDGKGEHRLCGTRQFGMLIHRGVQAYLGSTWGSREPGCLSRLLGGIAENR